MKNGYTDIIVILDRSGSMERIRTDTVGGFNQFVKEQRAQPGQALLTLSQFDDQYEIVYQGKPIAEVPSLDLRPRGSTALLDAIGRTIQATGDRLEKLPEAERPEKVVVVIITDGGENASKEWTREKVFDLITHQRDKYNWQFVFLGANQDAISVGADIGILRTHSMTYAANAVGTQSAFSTVSQKLASYRGAGGSTETMSFDANDRAKALATA